MRTGVRLRRFGPLPSAAAVALMIWIAGGWNGASFNPVWSLGPAIFAGNGSFFVYLVVPLVASVLVAALPRALAARPQPRPKGGSVADTN